MTNAKAHMNFKLTRVEVHLCHRHAKRLNYLLRLLRKGRKGCKAGLRDKSLENVHSFEQEAGTSAYLAWLRYCSGRANRNSASNKLLAARPRTSQKLGELAFAQRDPVKADSTMGLGT